MTQQEFKQFFDALPVRYSAKSNQATPYPLTKGGFAEACQVPVFYLREISEGKRPLNQAAIDKVLPVMRRYGFQG